MVKEKILKLFEINNILTVKEITDELLVSRQTVHHIIRELTEEGLIIKLGRSPKTFYKLKISPLLKDDYSGSISEKNEKFLKEHFLLITETGEFLEGFSGFKNWCLKRQLPVKKTLKEYVETKKKYEKYYDKYFFVNGMEKLTNTKGFQKIWVDNLYYFDFYAIERFGKTKFGTILHFAKQGQSKILMKLLTDEIYSKIHLFVERNKFDAVGFIPPTIKRELQIMSFLKTRLKINLPYIDIIKVSGMIPVPQKSLSKLEERINNAENTFIVKSIPKFKNVLLIDDAVGSGATINQIAGKIKNQKISEKVSCLAIVGSFKGFDVITDV